ncbi:T9SS type A sorting domain-containing protein [Dyadobacter sp. CY347]|uniref:T9SS type A sorting domain-containing protein n=1 Tax=Dyadobacter sp. CY347 TaxID=2909336 RepID=UPI001F213DD9|nr:T9SS type A sorting domain-containing protein [Dyadobacter sp. CY347]MCF2489217.1 T9SS type A sorting domain-containing protein [Dyadobacter sp. CY347]
MKQLLLLYFVFLSFQTYSQIVILEGCTSSEYNVNGPYYLSGTDAGGRNIYEANYSVSSSCMGYCNPQFIQYNYNQWVIRAGILSLASNDASSSPDPPTTGWVKASYSPCAAAPSLRYPGTVSSKNCEGCSWNDPATWEGGVVPAATDHVVINGNVLLDTDASCLNLTIGSGKSLDDTGDRSFQVKGKFMNEGLLEVAAFTLGGYNIQQTLDGTKLNTRSLTIDNKAGVTLTGNLSVLASPVSSANNVHLVSGFIDIGNFDLTCNGVDIIGFYSRTVYQRIVTTGTGSLKYVVPGGAINKEFLIGKALLGQNGFASENFTPVTITGTANSSSSAPVTIAVRVASRNPAHPDPENTQSLDAEWNITSDHVSLEQPFSLKFGWPALNPLMPVGFDLTNIYVKRWGGTDWENKAGPKYSETFPTVGYGITVENVTQFSAWGVFDSETTLPVNLVDFAVSNEAKSVLLTWKTSGEENSRNFEIQHSTDSKAWSAIGDVKAAGESQEVQHYTYTHSFPAEGLNYYRLKMIDRDESFAFSRVLSVRMNAGENAFLYPNPVSDHIQFRNVNFQEISKAEVVNDAGKVVSRIDSQFEKGISVKNIPSGHYIFRIYSRDGLKFLDRFVIGR